MVPRLLCGLSADRCATRVLPNGLYEVKHGVYRQLWMGGSFNRAANSEYQMRLFAQRLCHATDGGRGVLWPTIACVPGYLCRMWIAIMPV